MEFEPELLNYWLATRAWADGQPLGSASGAAFSASFEPSFQGGRCHPQVGQVPPPALEGKPFNIQRELQPQIPPQVPEDVRLDQYSKFFNFKKLEDLDFDALKAIAANANISVSQAGALKGRLMNDWSVYARMVKAGYKVIPEWVARPPPGWTGEEAAPAATAAVAAVAAAPAQNQPFQQVQQQQVQQQQVQQQVQQPQLLQPQLPQRARALEYAL